MAGENILKSEVAAAKAAGSTGVGGNQVQMPGRGRVGIRSWCRRRMIMGGEDLEMLMKILV
jgi:hypothetical protein